VTSAPRVSAMAVPNANLWSAVKAAAFSNPLSVTLPEMVAAVVALVAGTVGARAGDEGVGASVGASVGVYEPYELCELYELSELYELLVSMMLQVVAPTAVPVSVMEPAAQVAQAAVEAAE